MNIQGFLKIESSVSKFYIRFEKSVVLHYIYEQNIDPSQWLACEVDEETRHFFFTPTIESKPNAKNKRDYLATIFNR